jgi:hypothetical protein
VVGGGQQKLINALYNARVELPAGTRLYTTINDGIVNETIGCEELASDCVIDVANGDWLGGGTDNWTSVFALDGTVRQWLFFRKAGSDQWYFVQFYDLPKPDNHNR